MDVSRGPPRRDCPLRREDHIPFDIHTILDGILDADSFFEIKPAYAGEVVVGFGRVEGNPVGIVANNSVVRGGVLFVDSADKAARYIEMCDAYNVPLVYLADVPGFMLGSRCINAVYAGKLAQILDPGVRAAFTADRRRHPL